jgi:hypothetical protein
VLDKDDVQYDFSYNCPPGVRTLILVWGKRNVPGFEERHEIATRGKLSILRKGQGRLLTIA